MIVIWLVQLVVAFLIYRDAKDQKMLAPVWAILGLLPMFGYFADLLYLIIREFRLFPGNREATRNAVTDSQYGFRGTGRGNAG